MDDPVDIGSYLQRIEQQAEMQKELLKTEVREMEEFFKTADKNVLENFASVLSTIARSDNAASNANYWRGYVEGILLSLHDYSLAGDVDYFDPTELLGNVED